MCHESVVILTAYFVLNFVLFENGFENEHNTYTGSYRPLVRG